MAKGRLKKKVFVTPEKPGIVEKTCWIEDVRGRKPKSKAKDERKKNKKIAPQT